MPRERSPKEPSKTMTTFTIGVLVIMVISAGVLYVLQHTQYGRQVLNRQQELPNLNALLDQVTPTDEQISQAFQPRLDTEAMVSKDIGVVTKDGQLLRTRVSKPAGQGPFPVIVIIHDAPSSTRNADQTGVLWGEQLSTTFNALTITPDWRDSQIGEEEVTDIISVIDWLKKLRETNGQPITLFGMDHGVYMALSAMAAEPESVHGLIAAYGYSDIQAEYQFLSSQDELGAKNFLERTGCSEQTAVELCLKDLSLTSLQISVPTLIIHPQNDSVVPVSAADQIASQVTDPTLLTKDIVTEAGIDHFFLNKEDNAGYTAAQKTITDWLTRNL